MKVWTKKFDSKVVAGLIVGEFANSKDSYEFDSRVEYLAYALDGIRLSGSQDMSVSQDCFSNFGIKYIKVIKFVLNCGLREAKELAEQYLKTSDEEYIFRIPNDVATNLIMFEVESLIKGQLLASRIKGECFLEVLVDDETAYVYYFDNGVQKSNNRFKD